MPCPLSQDLISPPMCACSVQGKWITTILCTEIEKRPWVSPAHAIPRRECNQLAIGQAGDHLTQYLRAAYLQRRITADSRTFPIESSAFCSVTKCYERLRLSFPQQRIKSQNKIPKPSKVFDPIS